MNTSSGIYQIVNKVTQKRYIGLTSNMNNRKQGHLYDLRRGKHSNDYLQKAWNKYGETNFEFSCIEECPKELLYQKEDYWVKILNVCNEYYGYNLKPTDPFGSSIHSEETRAKISATHKAKKLKIKDTTRKIFKKWNDSEEGKTHVIKMREKLKNIDYFKVHEPKRKKVMNTITGEIYESLRIASDKLNIPKYELSRRLLGKRKNNTNLIYLD